MLRADPGEGAPEERTLDAGDAAMPLLGERVDMRLVAGEFTITLKTKVNKYKEDIFEGMYLWLMVNKYKEDNFEGMYLWLMVGVNNYHKTNDNMFK